MYLMHKSDIVAKIELYNDMPISVSEIYKPELMPVGMQGDLSFSDCNITSWHQHRTIPHGRVNLKEIESVLGPVENLSMRSMGLSLTDCYWYVEENKVQMFKWEDINFHDNGFVEDLLLLKENLLTKQHNSPDYTTDGVLDKCWFYENGSAYLIKNGMMPGVISEPVLAANEVVASRIANRLGIPCVEYDLLQLNNEPYCVCRCFSNPNEDIVTAQNIADQLQTRDNFLVRKYIRELGFSDALDQMAIFHVLIHNHDAHLSNFALAKGADTGAYIRFVPLYDNGSSLNWNHGVSMANNMRPFESRPYDYLQQVNTIVSLPPVSELCHIIKDVYQKFTISEEQTIVAMNELQQGYSLVEERMRELTLERERCDEKDLADE